MIRTLAALALLTTSTWAQTAEAPAGAAPNVEVAAAATEAPATAPTGDAAPLAAAQAIPTDPMELAAFARANALEPAQCRFAFSRAATTAARVACSDADAEVVVRFDPRLAIGERWTVVRAERQQRALQRNLAREDRKALPFDLIALTAEGEWTMENLAFATEHPDRYVYSFVPRMIPERSSSETGQGIIEQLIGEVEISRETGRVIATTLREPPEEAVRALGIVRVRRALLRSSFADGPNALHIADGGSQMMSMSALLTQTELTTTFRYTDVEAICDPAEVARIGEAEAAALAAASSRRR